MKNYRYRVSFKFPYPGVIAADNPTMTGVSFGNLRGGKIILKGCGATCLTQASEFEISNEGFDSPESAWQEAKEISHELLVLGADLGIGIDVGKIELGTYSAEKAAPGDITYSEGLFGELPEAKRQQVIPHKLGITVVEQVEPGYDYITLSMKGHVNFSPFSADGFINLINRVANKKIELDEHKALILELYNAGFFEAQLRTRFLTWIMMLETIGKSNDNSSEIINFVDHLSAEARKFEKGCTNVFDLKAITSIKSQLGFMKYESIRSRLQRIAMEAAGKELLMGLKTDDFIKKCYDVRSDLVHNGTPKKMSENDFAILVSETQRLAILVIRKMLGMEEVNIEKSDLGHVSDQNIKIEFD